MNTLDYLTTRELLDQRKISCGELVNSCLHKIEEHSHLNAFISLFPDKARQSAKKIDDKLNSGQAGKLAGLVIAVKDNISLQDELLTCGSKILSNFSALYNATVVQRLIDEDAIIIGKTNLDQFGMGSSNENSFYGDVKNPHDPARIPGGSSGGSAAAVTDGLVTAALGSDTGGSVRQPASMCGVIGLKPSYGRVSRNGLVAFASSLDQIGPISQTVKDSAAILSVIAGHDKKDSTSASIPVPNYFEEIDLGVKELYIAYPREYFTEGMDKEVKTAIENVLNILQNNGAIVEEISLPHTEYAIATYYILATAEASANLARYDGVRYGFRAKNITDLEELYVESRSQGFGDEVKRRIMLGTYVLSTGYYEAYYRKAQKVRTLIKQDFDQVFEKYGCIITPTSPTTAFKLGEKINDPLQMYLSDIYTTSANLAGINSMSIPCGVDKQNLPIGVQLMTQAFQEKTTFRVAQFLEEAMK